MPAPEPRARDARHHVAVIDHVAGGVRLLKFDRYVESSISLEPPHRSLSSYTDYFHLAFLLLNRVVGPR